MLTTLICLGVQRELKKKDNYNLIDDIAIAIQLATEWIYIIILLKLELAVHWLYL